MKKVIKRDGKQEQFNSEKIRRVIKLANNNVPKEERIDDEKIQKVLDGILKKLDKLKKIKKVEEEEVEIPIDEIEIERIQDFVEKELMQQNCFEVAKAFILFREERNKERFKRLDIIKEIEEKLKASNVLNQNANVDEKSFGGRKGEADSALMKELALNYYISPKFAKNHINNRVYIHDLDSYVVGMHNCGVSSTKFITDKGVYSFADFKNGDEINVLTHTNTFKKAIVKSYGKKIVNKITFNRGTSIAEEYFTPDHRWILENGKITTNLKIGDKLLKTQNRKQFIFDECSDSEKYYWCLGFVLGDDTEAFRWSYGKKVDDIKFVRLKLCGEKIKYANRFNIIKHSSKELENGDLYLTFSSTIGFKKQMPDVDKLSIKEKRALFEGLYAADGVQTTNHKSIFTSSEEIASFIEYICPLIGYYILSVKDYSGQKTNYGIREFGKEYSFIGDENRYYWTVLNIEEAKEEETWCLEVEEDHSFVLPNGIITGNCLSVPIDELLANGFKTRQVFIRPAGSANTAFQLVAVLFQLQSLQQFGGVAATHLDWSLVPYVRKSFMKHYIVAALKNTRAFKKIDLPRMMFEDYQDEGGIWRNKLDDWIEENKEKFFKKLKLKKEDFYFDNKKLNKKFRQQAVFDTIQEVKQAAEGMLHNLNSLQSRSGNQLPFSSINYGTCTEEEGRIVTRAILGSTIKGVGNGQTSIFPCQIFQKMKGVNDKGSKNYDLYKMAIRCTAKRMYPNYCNCDWSKDQGYNDMEYKTNYLNNLSDEQKENLIKAIEENPEIGAKLGLYVKESK